MTTKITFGKHKGFTFEQVPLDYVKWMAGEEIVRNGVNFSQAARDFVRSKGLGPGHFGKPYVSPEEMEEIRFHDEIEEREAEEARAVWEAEHMLEWVAGSGQHIRIQCVFDVSMNISYEISVDSSRQRKAYEIIDLPKSPAPGIVAKIGNIGLTAERRDALVAMAK
jgi:hypothetical protein